MQVIISHTNLDFDGLASMVAAKKLYPSGKMVLPEKLQDAVQHFLSLYRDTFSFTQENQIDWESVTEVILVDTSTIERVGRIKNKLPEDVTIICYDHHASHHYQGKYLPYGACITILIEDILRAGNTVSAFEATLFTLGLQADTGNYTYSTTSPEDMLAGYHLLKAGANLEVVERFRDTPLSTDEQQLIQILLTNAKRLNQDGTSAIITQHSQDHYTGNLAGIASHLLSLTGVDALFVVVRMENKTFITARSSADRLSILAPIKALGGGGHDKAASAMRKDLDPCILAKELEQQLPFLISTEATAKEMMSSPVRVVAPDTTIGDVSAMLYRYGHSGFPVVKDEKLVGVISRRNVDKAIHHGLGHAPVKGYMTTNPMTISLDTSLTDIQEIMMDHNVGRLPVIENDQVLGIVSRTDVIRTIHHKNKPLHQKNESQYDKVKRNFSNQVSSQLKENVYKRIHTVGKQADSLNMKAYLIGGIVRDILLERPNEDIDIVVEGNAIVLGESLSEAFGGSLRSHDSFKTATWTDPEGLKVDLTSARTEYYDFPAALPSVELSNIKEDLYRRDFTINALAISLSEDDFGTLLDFFHGYEDIHKGRIKTLYNLSFLEDPTRILRALRFENRFGFLMNKETEEFAKTHTKMLSSVSKPRLANELKRLIIEEDTSTFIKRASDLQVLEHLLTRASNPVTVLKRIECFYTLQQALKEPLHHSHWLGILFAMTDLTTEAYEECLAFAKNKQDIHLLKTVYKLFTTFDFQFHSLYDWHTVCAEVSNEALAVVLALYNHQDDLIERGSEYLLQRQSVSSAISGNDLIDLGLIPGPHFKQWLLQLEASKIENPSLTKTDLLSYAKKVYSQKE